MNCKSFPGFGFGRFAFFLDNYWKILGVVIEMHNKAARSRGSDGR